VKFEGSNSRRDAERLRGALHVETDDLRQLDDGEFWQHDVVGCEVVTLTGDSLGRVAEVVPGIAHDLLRVEVGGADRLIPMVKDIVVSVDPSEGRVVVDPPEGLLDQ
jgi:16S rRNA processing protein RimM